MDANQQNDSDIRYIKYIHDDMVAFLEELKELVKKDKEEDAAAESVLYELYKRRLEEYEFDD